MRITQWLVFLASLSLIFRAGYAVSENREQVTTSSVTFVLTADMPNISDARTGRYANLQTLVKQQRQISETVFFIFGGGSIGPSALSSFDRGSHIIDILNSLEPDVMGVTKREFSFYEDELSLRSYEAAFPLVASNVIDNRVGRSPDGLHTSVIVEKEELTLGVISVLHERVIEEYQLSDITITPPQKAIMEESKRLRQQGADIILLHYSYPFPFINTMLNKRIILRLIALTNLVEKNSEEVASFEGSDEISRLAKTFALYFERVKSQETELIRLSLSDPLTNIPNRRAFKMEMEKAIAMSKRYDWPLTVVILDVDSFKLYNDNYGHPKGDECLKAVAIGLNEVITRNTDFCARYGGEEFVAILPNTDEKGAKVKAEEIRDAIESLGIEHSKSTVSPVITASLGVATVNFVNHHNWTLTSILNTADRALYDAKTGGRNRCVFSSLP